MNVKPIRVEADYDAALAEVEQLMDAKPGTRKGDRLDVLVTTEICSDTLDNDCDGLVDADDQTDCATCPCEDHWNDGVGAPPISTTDLSSFACEFRFGSPGVLVGPFVRNGPDDASYQLNHVGSNTFQCQDRSVSGGASSTSAPFPLFSQADMDACQALMEAQGCVFP